MQQALQRAYQALHGLATADALGALFEFSHGQVSRRIRERIVPEMQWHWSDDTHMALIIAAVLRQYGTFDADAFVEMLVARYERSRGYGRSLRAFVQRVRAGAQWRTVGPQLFGNQGSFGNACASRVAPLAAFYATDLDQLRHQASISAGITHAHPEAIAGTIAVAVAVALAWQQREAVCPAPNTFLGDVIEHVPESIVKEKLLIAQSLSGASVEQAVSALGNGSQISVQDTVPFALWCAATRLDSYEEAIWLTLAGQGDCDTTCAIVGGIVVMRHELDAIPAQWQRWCEPLPDWVFAG